MAVSGGPGAHREAVARLREAVCGVLRGKREVVDLALTAILAEGHVLLEDVPGVGKTTLARALAGALGVRFARVQFTADLLPGDLTGTSVLQREGGWSFRPGPLFAHVVLADEINRSTPKTQSALLEAMEEGQVTVDGETRALPRPFLVVATQNPFDSHGSFHLPESQLDRFLMRLSLGYPDRESERAVLRDRGGRAPVPGAVLQPEALESLMAAAAEVRFPQEVEDHLLDLVRLTREDSRLLRGVSPRGARALYRACRARALVQGRGFVVPEDVRALVGPVLAHRVVARSGRGRAEVGVLLDLLDELGSPL